MRLRLCIKTENPPLVLPINYNHLIQAFIYNHLDAWLATKLHNKGFEDPLSKRRIKFFTFSRLISKTKPKVKNSHIIFNSDIYLIISSPYGEFIQSFAANLFKSNCLTLGEENLQLSSVEVLATPNYAERILVKTLSPITVYSTVTTFDGRKKVYYYSPFEEDFEKLLIKNLQRKARIWFGEEVEGGSIKPFKVEKKDEKILKYQNNVIKGWDGIFELNLPPKLFQMAFEAGLGAKNSGGFGCIEVWKGGKDDSTV